MSKKSVENRNERRKVLSAKKRDSRLALKKIIKKGDEEACDAALIALQKTDRNESPCRVRNRCNNCARSHGVYKKFGLCRICLRQAVMCRGDVPGLRKASW